MTLEHSGQEHGYLRNSSITQFLLRTEFIQQPDSQLLVLLLLRLLLALLVLGDARLLVGQQLSHRAQHAAGLGTGPRRRRDRPQQTQQVGPLAPQQGVHLSTQTAG